MQRWTCQSSLLQIKLLRLSFWLHVKHIKEVKEVDLYSAFIVVPHTQGAQVRPYGSHSFYLQITPYLPLPRKRSPDGASPDWGCGHLIVSYYSFIYPERMKGWVGLSSAVVCFICTFCFVVMFSLCFILLLCFYVCWYFCIILCLHVIFFLLYLATFWLINDDDDILSYPVVSYRINTIVIRMKIKLK